MDKIDNLKQKLTKNLEMKNLGKLSTFLGITIEFSDEGVYLSQRKYNENLLNRLNMTDCKAKETQLEKCNWLTNLNVFDAAETDKEPFEKPVRELIGCIMYLMTATRPDLTRSINIYSRFQKNPSEKLWQSLKRILRYLKVEVKEKSLEVILQEK